ncbi:MAG: rod shape-determining protein [Clostridia bacterium]
MLNFGLGRLLMQSIAIDFGTVNTLIAIKGKGIVLREPSAIAVATGSREIIAVGHEAISMLGRTPGGINIMYPMRDGVVADFDLAEAMLRLYIEKALGRRMGALGIQLMLCLPMCVTGVERRALTDAAKGAGAREVLVMDEPVAAALGAGLSVYDNCGTMVVDIGGGTTDAAVLAFGGVAAQSSVRVGGTHIDAAITSYMLKEYDVMIGERTAEDIKHVLGSAVLGGTERMQIRGRDREKGLPVSITICANEINRAIMQPVRGIANVVADTLAATPPELSGDIIESGITLTGGGALLRGIDKLIGRETGMEVRIADSPLDCVAIGALLALQEPHGMELALNMDAQATV